MESGPLLILAGGRSICGGGGGRGGGGGGGGDGGGGGGGDGAGLGDGGGDGAGLGGGGCRTAQIRKPELVSVASLLKIIVSPGAREKLPGPVVPQYLVPSVAVPLLICR